MIKTTCAVLIAISAAMGPTSAQDRPDEGRQSWTLSIGTGWTRLHVEARGRVELTDDERAIKSVSPNGSFEISSKGWLSLFGQQYLVRGNADGTTTRRLSVGGAERPIDAEARAWIADTIQRLVRNGFGAEARIARIFAYSTKCRGSTAISPERGTSTGS
jgi:hypothetical protein